MKLIKVEMLTERIILNNNQSNQNSLKCFCYEYEIGGKRKWVA